MSGRNLALAGAARTYTASVDYLLDPNHKNRHAILFSAMEVCHAVGREPLVSTEGDGPTPDNAMKLLARAAAFHCDPTDENASKVVAAIGQLLAGEYSEHEIFGMYRHVGDSMELAEGIRKMAVEL